MFDRLKCLIGLHDFRIVFESLGDGHADDEKGVVCRRCGLSAVRRADAAQGLRRIGATHRPRLGGLAGAWRPVFAVLSLVAVAGWAVAYLQYDVARELEGQLASVGEALSSVEETLRTEREAANKLLSALEQTSPNGGFLKIPYVVVTNANVRIGPSTESGVVKTLEKGAEINVLEVLDDQKWYRIAYEGEEVGFVFGELIEPAGQ